jgi:hypothetical protein
LAGIANEFHNQKIPIAGGDLMKRGTSALIATAIFFSCIGAATAQTVIYGSQAYYGRGGPPPDHAPLDGALPSYEVAAILRSGGFLPLGGPIRRGNFYVVAAAHPSGDEGRVVIDVFSGRIVRFVPGSVIRASRGGDDMVLVYQGPTFPPPDGARPMPPPPPAIAARSGSPLFPATRGVAPRPPGSVPNVASRTPSSGPATPKPRPQVAPAKPDSAQAPPVPAPVETKPAAASPPLVPKPPAEKAPAVQPTRTLPPVQTME